MVNPLVHGEELLEGLVGRALRAVGAGDRAQVVGVRRIVALEAGLRRLEDGARAGAAVAGDALLDDVERRALGDDVGVELVRINTNLDCGYLAAARLN